jgi:GxxExxY protein
VRPGPRRLDTPAAGRTQDAKSATLRWSVVAASATKSAASLKCPVIQGGVVVAMAASMTVDPSEFNDITRRILAGAIEVHRTLGPGLLESIYTPCLHAELSMRKLEFVTQRAIQIVYKGMPLESSYRVDLIVEDLVVVELKSTVALLPVHQAQVLTYLEITRCPAGLLINFNVPRLMDGVKRLINPRATRKRGEP